MAADRVVEHALGGLEAVDLRDDALAVLALDAGHKVNRRCEACCEGDDMEAKSITL